MKQPAAEPAPPCGQHQRMNKHAASATHRRQLPLQQLQQHQHAVSRTPCSPPQPGTKDAVQAAGCLWGHRLTQLLPSCCSWCWWAGERSRVGLEPTLGCFLHLYKWQQQLLQKRATFWGLGMFLPDSDCSILGMIGLSWIFQ